MTIIFTLLTSLSSPAVPTLAGWLVWFLLFGLIAYSLYAWRRYQPQWDGRSWMFFLVGLALSLAANLFIGLRISEASSALPMPGLPSTVSPGSAMMFFSAVPWMLGGGLLGPMGAAILGAVSGLARGIWDTSSFFTMLEYAALGVLFSVNMRQTYRTTLYRFVRYPLVSALVLIPLHTLLYIIGTFFSLGTDIAVEARLDFAISNAFTATLTFAGEAIIAGIIAQIIAAMFPKIWGSDQPLQPSPTERSLETRFLVSTGAFISLLLLTLLIGDWIVAGRAAEGMLEKRLASAAESASQSVPFFLETGQNLAVQLASEPRMLDATGDELTSIISQRVQSVPYFDEVFVVDMMDNKLPIAAYPLAALQTYSLYTEEQMGMTLASSGVWTQVYSIPPTDRQNNARVSFIVVVGNGNVPSSRVLIGRATLSSNPFTQPLIKSLQSISDLHGAGTLLDENNKIIYYYSEAGQPPLTFPGERRDEASFYTDTAPDGTRQLIYYQPVKGRPWAIALTVPAQQAQQLALDIAMPMSIMIIALAFVALISLRLGLRVVTGSLQTLATEANRIAQGKLDHSLQAEGVDEVGQLRRAFEQMRVSLQARLEELNRLLHVSQEIASSLEMQDAVKPVLDAIQSIGANSVRVALSPSILPDTPVELPTHFASGQAGNAYAYLDDQILALAQRQEKIIIPNLSRSREFALDPSVPQPQAILAVALSHENRYYGVVWAGFDQPRAFPDSDVRFVTTLAGQVALAVANARLFLNVEAARRQLEAILNSTPDPVLVTDAQNRLLLANRAANQALGMEVSKRARTDSPTEHLIKQRELLELLQSSARETQSAEILLPDGRTYFATASSVVVEGRPVGRVCILRDITHFKELDTLKSDFVSTVSHDLRSPLTLMRGYATMLEMVGALNDQQQGYVKKIITGVENMARLVNNLLDLGRIEAGVGLQMENVPIVDVVDRAVSTLQLQAGQKNITLSVELPKDLPDTVQADQALLYQAIYNLTENALKYTPENKNVTVKARNAGNAVIFIVEDNGIGIAPEDLPRLFEKFYRGSQREARAQHGSGLGLAIVHSFAERHGGKVWVESKVGVGSAFFLQVPLTQKSASK